LPTDDAPSWRHEPGVRPGFLLPVASLWWREVVRFYRQPSRVIGGLASPLLFWVLIGSGLGSSFRHPTSGLEMKYLEYFFPGTLALILLFTAIFSTVSVIEDRREGFLQAVLVAPISRGSMVLAKILGGTTLAAVQGYLFLLLIPAASIHPTLVGLALTVLIILVAAFAMTGLGFLVAWPMESTQGFHSIMNLVLIPMWLLSGALFPVEGAAAPVRWLMRMNPLNYTLNGLRASMYWNSDGNASLRAIGISLAVTTGFGLLNFGLSVALATRPARGGR
jgi:ABC-2 type transport system permease protein